MNKKFLMPVVVIIAFFAVVVIAFTQNKKAPMSGGETIITNKVADTAVDDSQFVLTGFPESVPLYGLEEISSFKFFVNDDTSSTYLYGGPVNYYNVVFETNVSRTKLFAEYKEILESIDSEESSESKLVGMIGQYQVSVSQYSEDSTDVYLQVILPSADYQKENSYFSDYPKVVTIDPSWVEKESSYGLLNQLGGQIEHTQYFILDESLVPTEAASEPFAYFYNQYAEENKEKENFEKNDEDLSMSWNQDQYEVTLSFSKDHGRVYLMIRQPMN